MNKKSVSVLLGVFIGLVFFAHAFAQKEKEVMKRYDYSSPKASFESLKKAIKNKDIEGILIHEWLDYRLAEETGIYGMSYEDFLTYTAERMSKEGVPKETIFRRYNELRPYELFDSLKVTELDFVSEGDRYHNKDGTTTCWIILERKSDGKRFNDYVAAHNYDGTNEWWITLSPSGE